MEFGKTETTNYPKQIVLHSHPPVTSTASLKAGKAVLASGTVLSYDTVETTKLVAYDGTAPAVGVLLESADTATQTLGKVLVHGIIDATLITPNDAQTLISLAKISIYA